MTDTIDPDLEVIRKAYGWTIDRNGQVCGLTAGDMGYEDTGIVIPMAHLLALLLPADRPIEDLPGYKAGFAEAIDRAAMLHATHAMECRRAGKPAEAETHLEWTRRIRSLDG